jgi:DNA invertase Pin-like site-specific DNA recombinase
MVTIQAMDQKQVGMRILDLGMNTRTPTGKLMLTVLGGVAQFEQEMMLERQLEGIAKAQAAGKYRGRKPIAMERQAEVRRLAATGMAKARIALELKIGEATVYRILARDREQAHPASSA